MGLIADHVPSLFTFRFTEKMTEPAPVYSPVVSPTEVAVDPSIVMKMTTLETPHMTVQLAPSNEAVVKLDICIQNIAYAVVIPDTSVKTKPFETKPTIKKQILRDISGKFSAGRLTAVMGLSRRFGARLFQRREWSWQDESAECFGAFFYIALFIFYRLLLFLDEVGLLTLGGRSQIGTDFGRNLCERKADSSREGDEEFVGFRVSRRRHFGDDDCSRSHINGILITTPS
jgi:hypothetical protein